MSTPPDNRKCPRGHTFAVQDDEIRTATVPCPVCGAEVQPDVPTGDRAAKGRSLWSVMQGGRDADDGEFQAEASPGAGTAGMPDAGSVGNESEQPPQSRWSVVESAQGDSADGGSESSPVPDTSDLCADDRDLSDKHTTSEKPVPDDRSVPDRPRGLWAMMGGAADDVADGPGSQSTDGLRRDPNLPSADAGDEGESLEDILDTEESHTEESAEHILAGDDQEEDTWQVDEYDEDDAESVSVATFRQPADSVALSSGRPTDAGTGAAVLALICGVVALLSAGFNLLPGFWAKIPSTAVGLGALVWGYQSLNVSKRAPDRSKIRAMAGCGLACGLIGIFSGPMFLNSLGDDWRQEKLRLAISQNLELIGEGVEVFHEHHSAFPRAVYRVDDGVEVPMHSWLSALLPHTGYDALAQKIDRREPYDAPANFRAMSTRVPLFLVPNVEHQPTLRGLATAHFAGVGGETLTTAGRVDVGVFSRSRTIDRAMLTDGASQTMLAGEITRVLPAWGEPGNWRTIGRGLNRQVSGFGNASGTGAHFLMADGSVKLFPNATSRDVLVKLSTRNGEDPVSLP